MPDLPVFDFKQPIQNVEQPFEEFVKEAKTTNSPAIRKSRKSAGKYLLVTLLGLNIVGLGVFGYINLSNNHTDNQPEVAGEVDVVQKNNVSGTGFSIVTEDKIPAGYKLTNEAYSVPFIQNVPGSIGRYLIEDNKVSNTPIKSGFEIIRAENNNSLNETEYPQTVKNFLGADYVLTSQPVILPNQINAYKLTSPKEQNIYYLAAQSKDNYYLIKVYNQSTGIEKLQAYTDFIANLENTLYLN